MNSKESSPMMNNPEKEHAPTVIELIAPDGLGFGEGGISVAEQIKQGILTKEVPRRVHEFLMSDPLAFKEVQEEDDGCGDGRPWTEIVQMIINENGEKEYKFHGKSRLRAKVFGGGLAAASSMLRTIKGVPAEGETVGQDRAFMAEELRKRNFSHGAHTGSHAEGQKCGCGAIDEYPLITANAVKYRENITSTLEALYGDDFEENREAIEQTFAVYEHLAEAEEYFSDAGGKQTMEQILDSGAVVKKLSGDHVEETIIINEVPGTTLDQQYFTETVKNACVEKPQTVQAFCVDVWRGKEIASQVTAIALEKDPNLDVDATYKLAYADFLVRTLAVAATLTAGDLPVYRHRLATITPFPTSDDSPMPERSLAA